jgi:Dolichyl-phosphate-mannose-protein mannosyltransferase
MTTLDFRATGSPRDTLANIELPDWTVAVHVPAYRRFGRRILAIREIGILTLVALIGYITAGWWMFYVKHFYINDELNRIADAIYVTIGRDPHLGAIGFYWPPLPQLLNCIFVPILAPFGQSILAGPVETAFCMALTIPVLAKLGKSIGVGRWTTFAICLVFAITPDAIYNSTNGMSEACFFLTGSLTMLGFLRYVQSRSTGDMILFASAMGAFTLTRLEGPFVVVVLVFVASFEWSNLRSRASLRQSAWTATLLGLPPALCFGLWMVAQWVLLKNPLNFLDQGGTPPPLNASWLPSAASLPWGAIPWALHLVVVLGMALGVALLGVVLFPRSHRTRGSIGILGAMGTIIAIQVDSVGFHHGYGDPRYFSMAVPFGFAAAMWVAARTQSRPGANGRSAPAGGALSSLWPSYLWNAGLVALLVFNAGVGNWTMSSGSVTGIERECTFFQGGVAQVLPFLGRGGDPHSKKNYCTPFVDTLKPYEQVVTFLDKHIQPSDRVLTDNSSMFQADVLTRHPNQFIVRNDRDWEKIVANPAGKVTYIVTSAKTRRGRPLELAATTAQGNTDYGAQIIDARPEAWKLVYSSAGGLAVKGMGNWVQLYKATGTVAPAGVNAPGGLGGTGANGGN